MALKTTRQYLDQVRDFHRKLGQFYTQLAELYAKAPSDAEHEKVKSLLKYMGRHEANLEKCLGKYEEDAARGVLDTWFQFTPEIAKCECFDGIELGTDMTVEDVIQTSLWYDDCLIKFFQDMAKLSVSTDVKELFANLAQMEEQEERQAARAALEASRE